MRGWKRGKCAVLCLSFLLAGLAGGQPPATGALPPGAKLFIAPMEWKLDQSIVAEIGRQALPVKVVATPQEAEFTMTAQYQNLGSRTTSPGHYINVKIVGAGGKPVWSSEVRDFGVVFAQLRQHGNARAARAIVRKLANSRKASGKRAAGKASL